jgi:hypothetical protein
MPSRPVAPDVVRLAIDPADPSGVRCTGCHEALAVHQPDVERPDRLLGVCPECRGWFLLDVALGTIVRLPDQDALRRP